MTGIVIVTWNSGEVIGPCLDACLAFPDVEIVIVDNNSVDDTVVEVQKRAGVRLIRNHENRGFAGGVNQGVKALCHPAVLLLNPDAVPSEGVAELAASALRPGVGAAGGKLLGADGLPQAGFNVRTFPAPSTLAAEVLGLNRLFPGNRWNRLYRPVADYNTEALVDQPAGAFLMLNRSAWEKLNGFDESFHPVWFEDVDYCRRLANHGYKILCCPSAVARHLGGHSASRLSWADRQLFWYLNLLRYAEKHFSRAGVRLTASALILACIPRTILGFFSGGGVRTAHVYSRVMREAWDCLRRAGPGDCMAGSSSREEKRARQYQS